MKGGTAQSHESRSTTRRKRRTKAQENKGGEEKNEVLKVKKGKWREMELPDADEAEEFGGENSSLESGSEMVPKPPTKNHNQEAAFEALYEPFPCLYN